MNRPRYSVSRKLFPASLRPRSIAFTEEQWGRIYKQARLDYKQPGRWIRDHILEILVEAEKNRPPRIGFDDIPEDAE